MRILVRFGLGLCGLVLVASPVVQAGPPAMAPEGSLSADAQVTGHHHKGVFGWRHCVACQRAWAKKHDGVDVPPPPSSFPAGVIPGQSVHKHAQGAPCAACEAGAVVTGPVTITESYPPGHSSLGGSALVAGAPGYAVVGGEPAMAGADPAPVGVSRAGLHQGSNPRMAAAPRPGAGSYDSSVMPSSMIPAPTGLTNPSGGRPHVISHLLGVGEISREYRHNRDSKSRARHAAISYDPPSQNVNELPASVVYGKGH
jgi:hypothetical protein